MGPDSLHRVPAFGNGDETVFTQWDDAIPFPRCRCPLSVVRGPRPEASVVWRTDRYPLGPRGK